MIKKKPIINLKDKKLFSSIKEGAEFYGINRNKISKMCRYKNSQFRFLKHNHEITLRGRDIKKLRKPNAKMTNSTVVKILELETTKRETYLGIFNK